MRASRIIAENVAALLQQRGITQSFLGEYCGHSKVWVSQFLAGQREWTIRDLDKVADLLGLPTYQLLQPGVSGRTERRSGVERRQGSDRRVSHHTRLARELEARLHPQRKESHGSSSPTSSLRQLVVEFEARLSRLLSQAESRGQTPTPRARVPKALAGARGARRSDPEET